MTSEEQNHGDSAKDQENVHGATDPSRCVEMAERYRWQLKAIRRTRDAMLKVDCVFFGEQTSFEDERYGD